MLVVGAGKLFTPKAWASWGLVISLSVIAFPHMLVRLMSARDERALQTVCRYYPIALTPHSDARGSFVETVRCRGGQGQSSFSTTVPGITRGDHYHLTKIERFAVIQGQARISLRKMFHDEVLDFDVTGDQPVAIDMPVGWVHNITNTGSDTLLTQFWSHELFRPEAPDTFPEPVLVTSVEAQR